MKFNFKFSVALAICALVGLSSLSQTRAQNSTPENAIPEKPIVIVDKDGERIEPIFQDETPKAEAQAGASASIGKDGKIIIRQGDGSTRELDTSGAQSIIVSRSSKSTTLNGEKKIESFGKAIIIGPNGERQEITLGTPSGGVSDFALPGFRGTMKVDRVDEAFVIGVHCEPVSEAIRSQLKLNSGLIVKHVVADSPAVASGIQKHDILMFADDSELKSQSDLAKVTQAAGKESRKLTFTTLRGGKEISVEVTPVKRPAINPSVIGSDPKFLFRMVPDFGGADMKFFGPGVIVGAGDKDGVFATDEAMKQVEEEMNQMRKEMQELREQMLNEFRK